jgi:hypothetical protein
MKKNIIIILSFIVLSSCDNTFDLIKELSNSPVIYFNGNASTISITDSLKTSLKTGKLSYGFSITGSGKGSPISDVTFEISGGTAKLYVGSTELQKSLGVKDGQKIDLAFSTQGVGQFQIGFTAKNSFGATASATLNLFVFTNLHPVAKFVAEPINQTQLGKYSYQLNAAASFDKDKSFGGLVKTYKYTITSNNYGTQTIQIDSPLTPVVFPGAGAFSISLVVYDNDGAVSASYELPQPLTLQ